MSLYLKRAVDDIRQNRFLNLVTIVTIALSILIVSAFVLFFINTTDLMSAWKKGMRIMVYLESNTPASEIPALQKKLSGVYGIEAVNYIAKEDALKLMRVQMKRQSSLLDNLKENPLPDAFEVRMTPATQNWDRLEKIALEIENLPYVEEVEYGRRWIGRFTHVINLFTLAGYALGGLFFMAAVFFVANTIRLVLYSRRDEVEIMRLVGAEDPFIKAPFYIEGIIQGALGGAIGLVALFIAFLFISSSVQPVSGAEMLQIRFLPLPMLAGIFLSGMLVGWLGCFVSLKQFFK
jgi:cell division transport system permease protein